ncbi:hypothetical protein A2316_01810 [Candidatus Falkowbacteria bacterium RIFOXYB2_FULL_38_15]|uniref:Uncharacterized protein n=1 Tax=Candidatus Falkowbacteria bacterium RIFOXYA2_FULL_38_12 TaxID=1797993 RepID=A0A1F5S2N1_9BACT|nr:MAG: hypothetical protein A2257_03590 [Candidatus Falkowbacteria bacterium RIFOXYA2_FULL_38_12]OGF32687.1 MAG: hypothetical protein A2316_01810 [Candidatus Falkowbacteria bacterium RIFOXYB2_FULL_38_15]OGF42091.1 MAG: hypothetical protein A2555_01705 [Candidatus Falkowbacteria bacterium RIFOXYD2_FULL_39_16]
MEAHRRSLTNCPLVGALPLGRDRIYLALKGRTLTGWHLKTKIPSTKIDKPETYSSLSFSGEYLSLMQGSLRGAIFLNTGLT